MVALTGQACTGPCVCADMVEARCRMHLLALVAVVMRDVYITAPGCEQQ